MRKGLGRAGKTKPTSDCPAIRRPGVRPVVFAGRAEANQRLHS
jgi:hypothetical protein